MPKRSDQKHMINYKKLYISIFIIESDRIILKKIKSESEFAKNSIKNLPKKKLTKVN